MAITLSAQQKMRRDTASNWTANNPTLLLAEWGYETDTKKYKVGDGSTAWNSLGYIPIPDTNNLLDSNLTVGGNLTVKGTTTSVNSVDVSSKDRNIHLAKVASGSFTGNCAASAATITNVSDTTNLAPGVAITLSSGGGNTSLSSAKVLTVDSTTQITLDTNFGGSGSATGATFAAGGPTNFSADGGGLTIEAGSDTDKTFNWVRSTTAFTSSEHLNIATGKDFKVNNASVLNATTLGSTVVGSSLTSVGTIGTGTWQGTVIAAGYLPDGTTSAEGVVQLEDSTSSTSTTKAATPASVKGAKDAADAAATTANAALPKAGGQISGNITCAGTETVDGRDLSVDGAKLDGIEASADVTDATNVNAAGAIMESDVDAKGDILAGTADNTVARLAVGTNGYVLKADSSTTTGLAWGADSATDSTKLPLAGGTLTGKVTHNYVSSIRIPSGTTAQRDGSPAVGDFRWNTTLEQYEGYDGSAWGEIGGSGATGSADLLDIASSSGTGGGSATFNGTAYRFKLVTKGTSTAVTPANAEILTVSINGILQKPNDGSGQGDMTEGYVVSGTDIIFDSPPAASSDYFIVNMGTQIAIGNASTVTVADESSDTTCFPTFVTAATGDLAAKTGSNLTFNSSSGQLAATSFAGDGSALTGIAGATADGCLYENDRTLSNNYTIASGKGAHCVGPLTINATLTINGRLVIS